MVPLVDAVDAEQRGAQFAAARAYQSRDAQHFAAAQLEGDIAEFARVKPVTDSTTSPRARIAWRGALFDVAPHHHADELVDVRLARCPRVPIVSPSRSTVTRSQMRKISSILCET